MVVKAVQSIFAPMSGRRRTSKAMTGVEAEKERVVASTKRNCDCTERRRTPLSRNVSSPFAR